MDRWGRGGEDDDLSKLGLMVAKDRELWRKIKSEAEAPIRL
jgi:hypothetical protein